MPTSEDVKVLTLPFGRDRLELRVPEAWHIHCAGIRRWPALTTEELRRAFANPIATPRISELAKGKKSVVILVEDMERPSPISLLMPLVLEELRAGGIQERDVMVISATGWHRPQTEAELRSKVGDWVFDSFSVTCHNPNDNLTYLGETTAGTPVYVETGVIEADLRIGLGGIIPHGGAAFGGGGKIILPGVCAEETIKHHHKNLKYEKMGGSVENPFRHNIEEGARMARLDVIADVVINGQGEIAALFVGDPVLAHRSGVEKAREIFRVEPVPAADVAIMNGFPLDMHWRQSCRAIRACEPGWSVRQGGAILFLTAAGSGADWPAPWPSDEKHHPIFPKKESWDDWKKNAERILTYSPHVATEDLEERLPTWVETYEDIEEAIANLAKDSTHPLVNVFAQGAISLATRSDP